MTTKKKVKKDRNPLWLKIILVVAVLAWLFALPFKKNFNPVKKSTKTQTVQNK